MSSTLGEQPGDGTRLSLALDAAHPAPAGTEVVDARIYRLLVESSQDLIWSVDDKGCWTFLNQACERIYGFQPEEMLGRPFSERILPEQQPIDAAVFQRLLGGSGVVQHETRHVARDGRTIDMLFSALPIRTAEGTIVGTIGTATDITERKNAQRRLVETEWRFRRVVEVIPDAIFVKARRRIVFVNPAAERLLEHREVLGMLFTDLFAEADQARLQAAIDLVKRTGAQFAPIEVHLLRPNREPLDIEINGGPFTFDGGEAVLLVARDITARKTAERALASERQYTELIIGCSPLLICGITDDGTTVLVNPAVCRTTGYAEQDLLGSNWWTRFYPGEEYRQVERLFTDMAQGPVHNYLMALTTKDGCKRQISWNSINRRGADGKQFVIGLGADVTEHLVMQAQLQQGQKLESIGQLAAGIAHEINTPTQFVGDNLRFLKDALTDIVPALDAYAQHLASPKAADVAYLREEIPKAIDQSIEGISRVASIVQAMKEFSHPDLGEKTHVDLNAAIATTLTVARNEYKYVAELETDFAADLPTVPCHVGEINQTILNLIVNAAHAVAERGPERGLIRVTTRADRDHVVITISDSGAGIPEAVRPRLFTPFFTTKPVGKGTGQGLFLAHTAIVRRHGGSIAFETEVGKGTVFIIRLPLTGEAQE